MNAAGGGIRYFPEMDITNFYIKFDNEANIFNVGDNISGKIHITFNKPRKIVSLTISIVGLAEVEWANKEGLSISRRSVIYKGSEVVFSYTDFIAGEKGGYVTMVEGVHAFTFSVTLPLDVPSSFQGKHGNIQYTATATLDRPWAFTQQARGLFVVVNPIDLNNFDEAKEPATVISEKNISCLCVDSGVLFIKVSMPFLGFAGGQSIPLSISINNDTRSNIYKVHIILYEVTLWRAFNPSIKQKKDEREIAKVTLEGVSSQRKLCRDVLLKVPDIAHHNLAHCSLIKRYYYIAIIATMNWLHKDVVVDMPVYIGSIPLREVDPKDLSDSVLVKSPSGNFFSHGRPLGLRDLSLTSVAESIQEQPRISKSQLSFQPLEHHIVSTPDGSSLYESSSFSTPVLQSKKPIENSNTTGRLSMTSLVSVVSVRSYNRTTSFVKFKDADTGEIIASRTSSSSDDDFKTNVTSGTTEPSSGTKPHLIDLHSVETRFSNSLANQEPTNYNEKEKDLANKPSSAENVPKLNDTVQQENNDEGPSKVSHLIKPSSAENVPKLNDTVQQENNDEGPSKVSHLIKPSSAENVPKLNDTVQQENNDEGPSKVSHLIKLSSAENVLKLNDTVQQENSSSKLSHLINSVSPEIHSANQSDEQESSVNNDGKEEILVHNSSLVERVRSNDVASSENTPTNDSDSGKSDASTASKRSFRKPKPN